MADTEFQNSQNATSSGSASNLQAVPSLHGYVLEKCLGSGGQGTVWLARPSNGPNTRVAVKICDEKYERIQNREVRNLVHLQSLKHPNVVKFIEFLDSNMALVMEYIDGLSLKKRLLWRPAMMGQYQWTGDQGWHGAMLQCW